MTETTKDRQEAATFNGTRKLIRPHLPVSDRRRSDAGHGLLAVQAEDPLTHAMAEQNTITESSHAEAFYFQKQMQMQTEMMVVLEDGEELKGVIEWYDKCVVKLRVGRLRVLVYKAGIKYLFKASEGHPANTIMK